MAVSRAPGYPLIAGLLFGGLLWFLAAGLVLTKTRSLARVGFYVLLVLVVVVVAVVTLYQDVALQARLAADRGAIEAIRQAIAIYHTQHGAFPPDRATAEALVEGRTPTSEGRVLWQCVGQSWTYDAQAGRAALVVNDLRACRGD